MNEKVRIYGAPVLESEYFRKAMEQVHHGSTSVGEHSLRVAEAGLRIGAFFRRHGIRADERRIVLGALCHDLGIIGRYEKYANAAVTCFKHPLDSAEVTRDILPDMDKKLHKVITRHMFPMTILPPTSREGWIVSLADKYASIHDVRARRAGYVGGND